MTSRQLFRCRGTAFTRFLWVLLVLTTGCSGSTIVNGAADQTATTPAVARDATAGEATLTPTVTPEATFENQQAPPAAPISLELLLAATLRPADAPPGYEFRIGGSHMMRCRDDDLWQRNWDGGSTLFLADDQTELFQLHLWMPEATSVDDAITAFEGCGRFSIDGDAVVTTLSEHRMAVTPADTPTSRTDYVVVHFDDEVLTVVVIGENLRDRDAEPDALAALDTARDRLDEQRFGGFIDAPTVDVRLIYEVQSSLEPRSDDLSNRGVEFAQRDVCADGYVRYLNRGAVFTSFDVVQPEQGRLTGDDVLLPGYSRTDVFKAIADGGVAAAEALIAPGYTLNDFYEFPTENLPIATQTQIVLPGYVTDLEGAIDLFEQRCIAPFSGSFERREEATIDDVVVVRYIDTDNQVITAFRFDDGVLTSTTGAVGQSPERETSSAELAELTNSGADALLTQRARPATDAEPWVITSTLEAWAACLNEQAASTSSGGCDLEELNCAGRVAGTRCHDVATEIRGEG